MQVLEIYIVVRYDYYSNSYTNDTVFLSIEQAKKYVEDIADSHLYAIETFRAGVDTCALSVHN